MRFLEVATERLLIHSSEWLVLTESAAVRIKVAVEMWQQGTHPRKLRAATILGEYRVCFDKFLKILITFLVRNFQRLNRSSGKWADEQDL